MLIRRSLILPFFGFLLFVPVHGIGGDHSAFFRHAENSPCRAVPRPTMPDDIDDYLNEGNELYGRLVDLLRQVDSPERFDEIRDTLAAVWSDIAALDMRYPDIDRSRLSERVALMEERTSLFLAFNEELARIGREVPEVETSLAEMMDMEGFYSDEDEESYNEYEGYADYDYSESRYGSDELFEEIIVRYDNLITTIENLKTRDDALRAYDTLYAMATQLKESQITYGITPGYFLIVFESDSRVQALAERMELAYRKLANDGDMARALDGLDPLYSYRPSYSFIMATSEEYQALLEYRPVVERAIEVFRSIKTAADVDAHADELRELQKEEKKFDEILSGYRGEKLIEDDPELRRLLPLLGVEQMRVLEDSELGTKIAKLLEE